MIAEIERVENIVPEEDTNEEEKSEKTDKSGKGNSSFPGGKLDMTIQNADVKHTHKGKGKKGDGCEQDHNKIN